MNHGVYIHNMKKIMAAIEWSEKQNNTPLLVRFEKKYAKSEPSECWEWNGALNARGYGFVQMNKKEILAHRLGWFFRYGPIPDGLCVLHHCDNRRCVNPSHLFLGTRTDNNADCTKKGRNGAFFKTHVGRLHPNAKLDDGKIQEIRRLFSDGVIRADLARRFGVSKSNMTSIINGRTWAHVS